MHIILVVPFFIVMSGLVVQFLFAGIIRFSTKDYGLKKDYSLEPTVDVVISSYNEDGDAIYQTIESVAGSSYPKHKLGIKVFDDCSLNDSWTWIEKAAATYSNVTAHRNEVNKGKGKTVLHAVLASSADIIVTIDSDTILEPNAIREMVACFSDPKIALVGGVVGISNPNDNALTAFQVCIYYVGFYLLKIPEAYFHSVACISGCMSAIRRSAFLELAPDIAKRHWFGVPVRYSEDRFITHQTMLYGCETYISMDARCWTPAPTTVKGYWAQQLRWQRGAIGDFFRTLRYLPQNVRTIRPFAMYIYFFRPLVVVLLMSLIITFPLRGNILETLVSKAIAYLVVPFFAMWGAVSSNGSFPCRHRPQPR